jgi:hypothetical protein
MNCLLRWPRVRQRVRRGRERGPAVVGQRSQAAGGELPVVLMLHQLHDHPAELLVERRTPTSPSRSIQTLVGSSHAPPSSTKSDRCGVTVAPHSAVNGIPGVG